MKTHWNLPEIIDWRSLLLDQYKTLGLSEPEVMILLMVDYCMQQGESLISPDLLALKMGYDYTTIDRHLSGLMARGYLTLEEDDQQRLRTSLQGVQTLLIQQFLHSQTKRDTRSEETKSNQSSLIARLEDEFARPLSFVELETVRFWFEEGYDTERILLALKKASEAKVKNIRYLDKILLEWQKQDEQRKEGYSTLSEQWRNDLEKTIEIANIDWVDKHGK